MSTISIYTNKCMGKAFAIDIDKKLHLLTAAHIVGTAATVNAGAVTVNVLYKSTEADIALLSAPVGLKSFSLADDHAADFLEAYADKSCVQTSRSDVQSLTGDSGSPILVNNKVVAMLVGSCEETGCCVSVDKIHKFIQHYQQFTKLPKITIPKITNKSINANTSQMKTTFCEI